MKTVTSAQRVLLDGEYHLTNNQPDHVRIASFLISWGEMLFWATTVLQLSHHDVATMPITIPFDIWTEIANYLPDGDLWAIRTLNSALYHAAKCSRYRRVFLFDHNLKNDGIVDLSGCWERLRSACLYKRDSKLTLGFQTV
jgi:hypothetical protein